MMAKKLWLGSLIFMVCQLSVWTIPDSLPSEQNRNFIVFYEITDYNADIRDTVNLFIRKIIRKGDNLIIYSPTRAYGFSQKTLGMPAKKLISMIDKNIKRDTAQAGLSYRQLINEMKDVVNSLSDRSSSFDIKNLLQRYRQALTNLSNLRKVNQALLVKLAGICRQTPGDNHLILIFQKEMRPIPVKNVMSRLMENRDYSFSVSELFNQGFQSMKTDIPLITRNLTEAGIKTHFIYFSSRRKSREPKMEYIEHSGDMYSLFKKLSVRTGGIIQSTFSPGKALKKIFLSDK